MPEPIKLLTLPGFDETLAKQLQEWANERYTDDIANILPRYVGRRVQFKNPNSNHANTRGNSGRFAHLAGKLGKVTGAVMCLDDHHLFRFIVTLDFTGDVIELVSGDDFYFSAVTDGDIERQKTLKTVLAAKHNLPVSGEPVSRVKLGEVGPESLEKAVGKRVRVIDASRFPGIFLLEGFVSQVFVSTSSYEYGVRLDNGNTHSLRENEVRFL